ncbi:adenylate/guanylate cyclase domain-containing protein [Sulfitobacter sp. SK012]|uniref:CHASE2 domain-containing protein n=1 Tax=Sulfitobacter sp. SK012 TaxID=1389005 RepID=UPI000E0AB901|nr:adenylate/guanylate cyclase domain-containing protein [Sulfitobacter sp. SK012]AXI46328.1 adenylate/guanylate cyclase domain-containing protein [Sulfitobacter sp. SK012]
MRKWFSKWLGWVRFVAIIGLLCGLTIRVADPNPLAGLRNATFDFYHQSKPRTITSQPVAIIDVDDRSIAEIGQWPWPRTRIAELVEKTTQAGAVAIAFDIVFSEPDRLSPEQIAIDNPNIPPDLTKRLQGLPRNDDVLANAFEAARVVVGQTSVRNVAGNRNERRDMLDVPHGFIGPDPKPFLLKFPDAVQNLPQLEEAAAGHGMFTARPDPDGVHRRVPIVMSVQGEVRLGLAPELLRIATGGEPFAVRTNDAGVEGVVVARQLLKTAGDGTLWPYLSPSSPSRYISAVDLLEGRMPEGRLANHLVFVGTSAIGLEDFRATPLGVSMAGVEIHAQVLENILSKSALSRPNFTIAVELVMTLVLCLLAIIFAPVLRAGWLIISAIVLLAGYAASSYYLFYFARVLLDPSFPVIATTATVILMSTVNYLREERQRREIRSAFGQYVSPDLVAQLSNNRGRLTLGGETKTLTLLFSDVRGFTAIAEDFKDDPKGLTTLMNQFLTILSNGILDYKGTIDKFMGDAVMAFWNAPLDNDNHARAACHAALRMIADVEKFNRRRRATARLARMQRVKAHAGRKRIGGKKVENADKHVHIINVGIGINTGKCVVGNMGTSTRFDYTALGDPVNVASRLEGQSRYYGARIILGSNTARDATKDFALLELDTVRVVGKEVPENIFALVGNDRLRADPVFQQASSLNATMHAAYRAQDWDSVESILSQIETPFKELRLGLERYVDLYRGRVTDLRAEPPPPNWNGVFALTKK